MTILEAINTVDSRKHNTYTLADKLRWLSALDALVWELETGLRAGEPAPLPVYDGETPKDTVLPVPSPYDEMYLRWLEAKIDYHNAEFDKYNNAMAMFQAVFDSYRSACIRRELPKCAAFRYF